MDDIQYFTEVAQTGNISRAAERIGITQPSLSLAMKRLENALDCELFIRSRTGMRLTPAGKEFLKRSRQLLLQWEHTCKNVGKASSEVAGSFVIGCHPSVALFTLPYFIPKLILENTDLHISLKHDLSRKISELIASSGVDYGIIVNPVRNPDFVIKTLLEDDVTFWVSKRLASQTSFDPHKCTLICDPELVQVQSLLKKRKSVFQRVLTSQNLEVVAKLTESGVGIGILPTRVAKSAAASKLMSLSSELGSFKDKICLVYRADTPKTAAHKAIVDIISSSLI